MIAGELKQQVDRVWDAFWAGGIANPLEAIEQITYLIFIRHLDDLQIAKERKANRTGKSIENPVYRDDERQLRWSQFKNANPENMLTVIRDGVFPWLRNLGGEGSTYAPHMQDARFTIPTSNLLTKVVDLIDELPLGQKDTKGDIYEYMLGKIATAGQNGQFRTPRHIIRLMVEMTAPGPNDEICDPACGTAGFLMEAAQYVSRTHQETVLDITKRKHFNHSMFRGFDFDSTMLRIASMNMLLHEVEQPDIRYRDSLAESSEDDAGRYSLVLANPPFVGNLDYETTAEDLQAAVKTKKTELLFLALFVRLLKPGGRAAVIVPEGVLFGSTKAHTDIHKLLVDGHKVEAVVKLPAGAFKPYAGVSTAILIFTKTNNGGTDWIWFYEVMADGFSLNDKRTPLLPDYKLGPSPVIALDDGDHGKNNLPDVLARWMRRNGGERERTRTDQSFCVPRDEVRAADYDLSMNRYKEVGPKGLGLADIREKNFWNGIDNSEAAPPRRAPIVVAKLRWHALTDDGFERLLFNIVANAAGYVNPQWLMQTYAPDRGRDISAVRETRDVLSGVSRQRIIIQAKHWLTKSVRAEDISNAATQMALWGPPPVDVLVMATTGRFTADAVAWVERHNEHRNRPAVEMWPESQLELILAQMPHLVDQFKLKPLSRSCFQRHLTRYWVGMLDLRSAVQGCARANLVRQRRAWRGARLRHHRRRFGASPTESPSP